MREGRSAARLYLEDLRQACAHIQDFTAGMQEEDFLQDVMVQYAVVRAIEVLGEASKQLLDVLPDAPSRFPEIPFKEMYATRNRLIHGYASTNLRTVWRIVLSQIPSLRTAIEACLLAWPVN